MRKGQPHKVESREKTSEAMKLYWATRGSGRRVDRNIKRLRRLINIFHREQSAADIIEKGSNELDPYKSLLKET